LSASLPKADQQLEEWQTAIGCLIGAAEGRDFVMHARIGVLRASNRNIERTLTDRKEMRWGAGSSRGTNDNRLDLCRYQTSCWPPRSSQGVRKRRRRGNMAQGK
jgi:hypothetical protein